MQTYARWDPLPISSLSELCSHQVKRQRDSSLIIDARHIDYNAVRIQTQKIKSWSIFYSPNYSAPPRITLRTELARYEAHTPSNRYEPLFATVYRSALIATCVFQCMIGHPHLNTAMLAQAGVGEYELRQEGKFVLREAQGTADMRIKSHPFVRELAGLIESVTSVLFPELKANE